MIAEWLGADPRRCGWSPERDRERPRAWSSLLAHLVLAPPAHRLVKLQVTGPVTLACALERECGGGSRREALALAGEVAMWLAANVAVHVRELGEHGIDAVVVLDEPALHIFGTEGIEAAWDPLRTIAPSWGLHLCGPVPWCVIGRVQPDLLSFDLAVSPVRGEALSTLGRLLERGSRLCWGVVATDRREAPTAALDRLRDAVSRTRAGGEQSLLSPACGTARVSVARENEIATVLDAMAYAMGRKSPASKAKAAR